MSSRDVYTVVVDYDQFVDFKADQASGCYGPSAYEQRSDGKIELQFTRKDEAFMAMVKFELANK